jgi:hypothetical protein
VPGKRLEGPAPAVKEHKEVAVDPALFDRYTGRYELVPDSSSPSRAKRLPD